MVKIQVLDSRMSNKFLKNLTNIRKYNHKPIIIHQHSIGGEWESGMMIYDVIQQSAVQIYICMSWYRGFYGKYCSTSHI